MTREVFLGTWALLALLAVTAEVLPRAGVTRWATAQRFLRTTGEPRWAAVVLLLGWMWLGWHLFAR